MIGAQSSSQPHNASREAPSRFVASHLLFTAHRCHRFFRGCGWSYLSEDFAGQYAALSSLDRARLRWRMRHGFRSSWIEKHAKDYADRKIFRRLRLLLAVRAALSRHLLLPQ